MLAVEIGRGAGRDGWVPAVLTDNSVETDTGCRGTIGGTAVISCRLYGSAQLPPSVTLEVTFGGRRDGRATAGATRRC